MVSLPKGKGGVRDNSFSLNPSKAFTDTHHLTSSQAEPLIQEMTDQKIPPVLTAQPDSPKGPGAPGAELVLCSEQKRVEGGIKAEAHNSTNCL